MIMIQSLLPLVFLATSSFGGGCPVPPCEGGMNCPEPCPAYAADCDVAYGSEPWQLLDVYLPAGWTPGDMFRPTVFYVHGGGWSQGDKRCKTVLQMIEPLVIAGYPVVSVNYELTQQGANPGTWPQPLFDVKLALAWVRGPGSQLPYGLPGCVAAVGTSAGGHLVNLLGATWDVAELAPLPPSPPDLFRPDLVLPISGPTDFFVLGCVGSCNDSSCATCPQGQVCGDLSGPGLDTPVEQLVGCVWETPSTTGAIGARSRTCRRVPCTQRPSSALTQLTGDPFIDASPIFWVDGGDPACYQVGAVCDPLVHASQLLAYQAALVGAGVDANLVLENGSPMRCLHALGIYGPAGTAMLIDQAVTVWWPSVPSYGTGSFCR